MLTTSLAQIDVSLPGRSYSILIGTGLLEELGKQVKEVTSPYCRKVVIVSNKRVFELYKLKVLQSLTNQFDKVYGFLISYGERYKTLNTAERLFSFLIENKIERHDTIIALGGGVVGDLA